MKILTNNLDLVCGGGTVTNIAKIGICGIFAWHNGVLGNAVVLTTTKAAAKIGSEKGIDLDYLASEFCAVVGTEIVAPIVRNLNRNN